ncbi:MAG: hypothetical protein ACRD2R_01975 [Terriglobales bacterium]
MPRKTIPGARKNIRVIYTRRVSRRRKLPNLELPHTLTPTDPAFIGAASSPGNKLLFALTIFLSAFLLFQAELLIGKYILPWFGGASAVWVTCLVYYQALLVAGYGYSHLLSSRVRARIGEGVHVALLLTSAALLAALSPLWPSPITPGEAWKPVGEAPVREIVAVLTAAIGLPFFLLSTTGPLLQHWYSRIHLGASPYRLYAVSNLGSLLGLVSYPLLVEPSLSLRAQGRIWALGYAMYVLGCAVCARSVVRAAVQAAPASAKSTARWQDDVAPSLGDRALWFSLAAVGSIMLLATTNLICQDVASVPLLWVLPLALYLLTLVLSFESGRLYRREFAHPAFGLSLIMSVIALYRDVDMPAAVQIYVYCLTLFTGCLVCHGELGRMKPSAHHLTSFYLVVAAGGATGGAFTALVAPLVFPGYWEYHLGLWLTALLMVVVLLRQKDSWLYVHQPWLPLLMLLVVGAVPEYLVRANMAIFDPPAIYWYRGALAVLATWAIGLALRPRNTRPPAGGFRWAQVWMLAFTFLLAYALIRQARTAPGGLVARSRNFYGALSIWEIDPGDPMKHNFRLMHGRIIHGLQLRAPEYRLRATGYYGVRSGAGAALFYHPRRLLLPQPESLRVGVVGLGVGTLAVYAQPGDSFRFYEINSAVIRYSSGDDPIFTYLRDARGSIEVVRGDARLLLEREAARGELQQFDVLALDAFTSDAIPLHLLTREAFELYLRHMRPQDGILAIHVSNKTLDLEPVVARLAEHFGLRGVMIQSPDQGATVLESDWILLSRSRQALQAPEIASIARSLRHGTGTPLWTDQFSNLISVLK